GRDRGARFVVVPAAVVEHRGAHDGFIGLGPREGLVAPMGGALSGKLGVIGLADQDQPAIGALAYDHVPPAPFLVSPFVVAATVADARCRRQRAAPAVLPRVGRTERWCSYQQYTDIIKSFSLCRSC